MNKLTAAEKKMFKTYIRLVVDPDFSPEQKVAAARAKGTDAEFLLLLADGIVNRTAAPMWGKFTKSKRATAYELLVHVRNILPADVLAEWSCNAVSIIMEDDQRTTS